MNADPLGVALFFVFIFLPAYSAAFLLIHWVTGGNVSVFARVVRALLATSFVSAIAMYLGHGRGMSVTELTWLFCLVLVVETVIDFAGRLYSKRDRD